MADDALHQRYHGHRAARIQRIYELTANPAAQVVEIERCRRDVVLWTNNWGWIHEPRETGVKTLPLTLFPFQDGLLRWMEERERTKTDGLVEKSRDTGASWMLCYYYAHRWLFSPGWQGGVGSRKLEYVDTKGDMKCIFEKLRFILRNLPIWMLQQCAAGFDFRRHSPEGRLINPQNGAAIIGEGGDNIGRGGRTSVYAVDESAYVEHQELVDSALNDNTDVRFDFSTPQGPSNLFARKRHSGAISLYVMDWKDDPRKNHWQVVINPTVLHLSNGIQVLRDGEVLASGVGGTPVPTDLPPGAVLVYPWYEEQKFRRQCNPVSIAQELDRDYTASVEGVIIPAAWVRASMQLAARTPAPTSGPIIAGLDVADGGGDKTVLVIRRGTHILAIYERTEGNTHETTLWALDHCRRHGATVLNYDSVGVGAGVAGTLKTLKRTQREKFEHQQPHDAWLLALNVHGVNVGDTPSEALWPDGRTSDERFQNLKAELWWSMAWRLEKTWHQVEGIATYPANELLCLPNDAELTAQLSNVLGHHSESGKQMVETKDHLKDRAVVSPNHAEALMLTEVRARIVRVG